MRRSSIPAAAILAAAALLALLSAGAASAQVVGTLPTGGTTAIRTGSPEGAAAPRAIDPQLVTTARAPWLTLQWWAAASRVKSAEARAELATVRRKLAVR